ncbi:hypothetical protein FEM48_Zijuj01G0194900 [Ziziphus jujuba var. spinosa]|uniref:Queuosine 5'-phosphate N-glycosylase/hydrolase n=1 Tax=Ziziphus jujuba var. spinosa TaxID=714518 RepID=A0A978W351_ZIZJJ|nr:hypothetical protein FEM48_Zijuj01G0194900 [Ziziphus jujuba var. spinosa]
MCSFRSPKLGIKDTLTAASGVVVPFLSFILHDGGISNLLLAFAYSGIVVAARWIAKVNTPSLLKALNDYPDYKVKVCKSDTIGMLLGSLSVQRTPNILVQKRTNICYRFVGCIPRPRICITIMVDYVVPVVLQQLGMLKYSSKLAKLIVANNEIDSGSEEEVKLWTCSIYAVERMKEFISKKSGKQVLLVYFLLVFQ